MFTSAASGGEPLARAEVLPYAESSPAETPLPSFARLAEGAGFLENAGQLNRDDVRFYTSLGALRVGFTSSALLLTLQDRPEPSQSKGLENRLETSATTPPFQGVLLRLTFDGAYPVVPEGRDRLPHPTQFFLGNNPAKWRTDVQSYREVVYAGLYDGIDLVYRVKDGRLKYEFHVAPAADPARIRWTVEDAEDMSIDPGGNLVIRTALGELVDEAPVAFLAGESSVAIPSRYSMLGPAMVGFAFDAYDSSRELIIDPGLTWSTFIGGNDDDAGIDVALDAGGNATVAGRTYSSDFPTTLGVYDRSLNGTIDGFVLRLNASGSGLLYSTFIGGSGFDQCDGIALDAGGNAMVVGVTGSNDFPTTAGAYDASHNGLWDVFVFRLNVSGSVLVYSTFVGGSGFDENAAIADDAVGTPTVTGRSDSFDFPTTPGAYDTSSNGNGDVFVFRLNESGSGLVYSTFIGGSNSDGGGGVAVDAGGSATVTGVTQSDDFPTTAGAYDASRNGSDDAFVLRLSASGSGLVYSTFIGGSNADGGGGVDLDAEGNATVSGVTDSSDFPTTVGAFDTSVAFTDAFVLRLNASGTGLLFSTFIGGSGDDYGSAVALGADDSAVLLGRTGSFDFPTTPGAYDSSRNDVASDPFILRLDPSGSGLLYSTLFGGSNWDAGSDFALDAAGAATVTGQTQSSDFPTTPDVYDTSFNGGLYDLFVLRIGIGNGPAASSLGVQGHVAPPGIDHVTDLTPDLNWTYVDPEGEPQSRYEVRVGGSPCGSERWAPGPQSGASTMVTYAGSPLSRGVYYFICVRVSDGNAWSGWAEARFRLNGIPRAPRSPISPGSGTILPANPGQTVSWTDGGDPDGDTVTFQWSVATDAAFGAILASGTTIGTVSTPFPTVPSSQYFWRAQANDSWEASAYPNTPPGYWTFFTNQLPSASGLAVDGWNEPPAILRISNFTPVLNWTFTDPEGDLQAWYDVRVGTVTGGNDKWVLGLQSGGTGNITYAGSALSRGVDYWFGVNVSDGADWSGWVETKFRLNQPPTSPTTPVLPGNGSSIPANPAQRVRWTSGADPDGDAVVVEWQVSTDVAFSTIVAAGTTAGTESAPFATEPSNAYVWRARAADSYEPAAWSSYGNTPPGYWTFTTSTNTAPTANAGPDQTVAKKTLVSLSGSGSDPDGDEVNLTWIAPAGITLSAMDVASPTFTAASSGTYEFDLVVSDWWGDSSSDTVTVTVTNADPIAHAVASQTVHVGTTVTLDGTASADPDGDALTYSWTAPSGITLSDPSSPTQTFAVNAAGTYDIALTVTDEEGRTSTDSVTITVLPTSVWAGAWLWVSLILILGVAATVAVLLLRRRRKRKPEELSAQSESPAPPVG